jgi:hypothetical protein
MSKKAIALTGLFLLLGPAAAFAYPPVFIVGAGAYAGYGSAEPDSVTVATTAVLDVDYRAAVGDLAYAATWYSGTLSIVPSPFALADSHDLGFLFGIPVGSVDLTARAAASGSTTLGDDTYSFDPEWSLRGRVPMSAPAAIEVGYLGSANLSDSGTSDRIVHGGLVSVGFDPTIALGFSGGIDASFTSWRDRLIGTDRREDLTVAGRLGLELLTGYFSVWNAELAGSTTSSNSDADALDVALALNLDTSPATGLSVSADLSGGYRRFTERATSVVQIAGSAGADWTPNNVLYLVGSLQGAWAVSADAALSGWGVSGQAGVQVRF